MFMLKTSARGSGSMAQVHITPSLLLMALRQSLVDELNPVFDRQRGAVLQMHQATDIGGGDTLGAA